MVMAVQRLKNQAIKPELFDTIIIGGGQVGLAAGYFLSKNNQNFIILDRNKAIGDSWRHRWDSLKLFTPSQIDNLPGMDIPQPKNYFPTKDEVANYLINYAIRFKLPVYNQQFVNSLSQTNSGFEIKTMESVFSAKNVIIASGPYQEPFLPSFADNLENSVYQLHSSKYLNPTQIAYDSILIVGAGNSGCEIALELARKSKKVWLSGRDVGVVPANSRLGKIFDGMLVWWFVTNILTVDTPIGRKLKQKYGHHGTPLGRNTRKEIEEAGITLVPRMSGVNVGKPQLEDGQLLSVDCIIWATGFKPDYYWVKLPIFDCDGYPIHSKGVVTSTPGLYFVGLPFQSGLSSLFLGGVGKDAEYITNKIIEKSN
jgi:putative flavoprotein involved in K+ transport